MKPEDFRQLSIKPGTKLSLISLDYGGEEWSYEERVIGTLQSYQVIEHHHVINSKETWDTAAVLGLPELLQTTDSEHYSGTELLLLHRHPHVPWNNEGPAVWVFGIHPGELLPEGPVGLQVWQPRTTVLSYGATLLVEDDPNPSEISRVFQTRHEWKKLKKLLNDGSITAQEYELRKKSLLDFPPNSR